jgi:FKBP-type peptidyl-prolyl cis-trans isomerase
MKKILVLSVIALLGFGSCGVGGSKKLTTDRDTLAYAYSSLQFGPPIAYVVADSTEDLDIEVIIQAIRDAAANKSKMTQEEANAFMEEYFNVRMPANNLKEAEAFLAETEKKSGVMKTESGLLYEILAEGGEKATQDIDTVKVLYKGTLPEGKVFDSTEQRNNEPAVFPLNGVIAAWTEGMKLVGEGGKIKLYAHPDLAYGPQARSQLIGPNQALVFEVEIIDVMPATAVPVLE